MGSQNIGDLLSAAGVTRGSFMGGFNLSIVNPNGTTGCSRSSADAVNGVASKGYIPHHSFFNYWTSTSNGAHTPPASMAEIGNAGPANHRYDIQDFYTAAAAGNFPAVSFLKSPAYQDGHAGYPDPLEEQTFLVNTINFLEALPSWSSTAVVILYDDSDGWYDHQMSPIVNTSTGPSDALTGRGACGTAATALPGLNPANTHALGRCGYGARQPLLVISPWAKQNFVDHTATDQTSIIRFGEDNWLSGQRIGQGSFDGIASSISRMFNFTKIRNNGTLFLNASNGERE
jgi:phospholipase C